VLILFLVLLPLMDTGCTNKQKDRSLADILKSGEITVITKKNAYCYYLYQDQAMGFEYDLAKAFADYLGVRLNIKIEKNWESMLPALENGSGDFIAASMTITPERLKHVLFSDGYNEIQQHIIVNRNNSLIKSPDHLAGKTVHVRKGTPYEDRLLELKEKGIHLGIQLYENIPTHELIRQVENNEIEATLADTNIALLTRRYYPKIFISDPISEKEPLGWAVNRNATDLLNEINLFFKIIKSNGQFETIYKKYYSNIERFDYLDIKTFHKRIKTRLPRYDKIIQEVAEKYSFDWRLIAAQIYQESHFDPMAQSIKDAYGLMQLIPALAEQFNVKDILDARQNIEAGTHYLRELYDFFDKANPSDRMYFALAAYNIGLGHILDARYLAREQNLDPNKWSSLLQTLPLLRHYEYNKNLKFGYAKGTQPIIYINQIMIYYDILKYQSIKSQT